MRFNFRHLTLFLVLFSCSQARAAQYQWSVPVESVISSENNAAPRAWLWIPPSCKQVRAVLVGQHNLLEETVLENKIIRQALTDLNMAEVWVSPAFDGQFKPETGAGVTFTAMMKALAQESGYAELEWAPVMPIGHSAMASYPYRFAGWAPERTLVAISIKGWYPGDFEFDANRLNGVPLLFINGEYEDANGRATKALEFRQKFPLSPLTMVADSGGGHFDFHDRLATYMALYLRKVAQYRLPAVSPLSGPVPLKPVDPTKTGWLYDRYRRDAMPKTAPAALNDYAGPKAEAFWAFDEETAKATDAYSLQYRLKKPQLLGYLENGELQPQNSKTHQQVTFKFQPQADGVTFKIAGTFIDTVPEGRPVGWTGLPIDSPITHSQNGVPVDVEVTTGPLKKVDDQTFVIQFGKIGFNNPRRAGDVWFQATHDGDGEYKRAVQQALLRVPVKNTAGATQTVTFDPIPDLRIGVTSLQLTAESSAGLPVSYYVESGPAEVDGDVLKFSPVPARAKTPIKVTVAAYQWGRSTEPRIQTAGPVVQTFYLLGPGEKAPGAAELDRDKAVRATVWQDAARKILALAPPPAAPVADVKPAPAIAAKPGDFGRAISFNFAKAIGMDPDDFAGDVTRTGNWNNLFDVKEGITTDLPRVVDSTGQTVAARISVTGGSTSFGSNSFDFGRDARTTDNDSRLFNGVFDQNEQKPTQIVISGIPYARYDVLFYRADDGANRAGKFQIGDQVRYIRGGKPNPDNNGAGYSAANDATFGNGTDIEQGNVVRFQNLSGAELTATFQAINAGDPVQRNKVAGFQIVERK